MLTVVGIRFKKAGKVYYFDPGEHTIDVGDKVVVETARGQEYGDVVLGNKSVAAGDVHQPLRQVVRIATPEDVQHAETNARKASDAFAVALDKIAKHGLPMKLVDSEYTFDDSKLIFYFTADGRVDFRELVKDLAGVFKTRIELRQIGVRDEAKMIGGMGPCGRSLCCATFLGDFEPVSIRMAKEQNLSLNPTKISGICGRLMCCLKYESEVYRAAKKSMPDKGAKLQTEHGEIRVQEVHPLNGSVRGRTSDNEVVVVKMAEVQPAGGEGLEHDCAQCQHSKPKENEKDRETDKERDKERNKGKGSRNRSRRPSRSRSKKAKNN